MFFKIYIFAMKVIAKLYTYHTYIMLYVHVCACALIRISALR